MATKKAKPAQRTWKAPKGYRPLKRPEIQKWGAGMIVEGVFLGLRKSQAGKFGESKLLDVKNERGERETLGCPTMLETMLVGIESGTGIYIECVGKQGRAWDFNVAVTGRATDEEEENED